MTTIKENTIPLILNGCKYWHYPIKSHLTVGKVPANEPENSSYMFWKEAYIFLFKAFKSLKHGRF